MGICCGKTKEPKEIYTAFVEDVPDIENDINYPKYDPPSLVIDEYDIYSSTYKPSPSVVAVYDIYNSTYKPPPIGF